MEKKEKAPNYDAYISCYNNTISHFYFYAENAALAQDHINHILNCEDATMFEWEKFPGQFHYIAYKKRGNENYKYIYTKKNYSPIQEPQFKELLKAYWQKEQLQPLIDSHKELLVALNILLISHYKLSGGLVPTDEEKYAEQIVEKANKLIQ